MKKHAGLLLIVLALTQIARPVSAQDRHPLTLDDVFELNTLSSAVVSPDGEWITAVVIRSAGPGEVYGKTFYELDSTRADVWLISRRTGERRNLTRGQGDASGFWCASWSPDGRRLAMLATRAEGGEPRGGDNVRLYVWDRAGEGLTRLSSRGMMTQTLGGSALYKVDMGQWHDGAGETARCSGWENAPFMWLDETTLLAVMLPPGGVSGLLDAYSRGLQHAGRTRDILRDGAEPTMTAVESGVPTPEPMRASLHRIDVAAVRAEEVDTFPTYPLDGVLQIALFPDGRSAALLTTVGAIRPGDTRRYASPYASWAVDKSLGFVELAPGSPIRWLEEMPEAGRYILDLQPRRSDGSAVAIRARPAVTTRANPCSPFLPSISQ